MENIVQKIRKYNIIDVLAVVFVALIVLIAAVRILMPDKSSASQPMIPVSYVFRVDGIPNETYENCRKHLPSKLMASGKLVGGEIRSVEAEPYYVLAGNGEWVEDTSRKILYFTVETETPRDDVITTKVGTSSQEVRIGKRDHILKSEYIELNGGMIVDVTWGDGTENQN